jgi:hypothetical protein
MSKAEPFHNAVPTNNAFGTPKKIPPTDAKSFAKAVTPCMTQGSWYLAIALVYLNSMEK